MAAITIKQVSLQRCEGRILECVKINFKGRKALTAASQTLAHWAETAPKQDEGYHKCDFDILFSNGETYHGRFDLQHPTVKDHEPYSIGQHVLSHLRYQSKKGVDDAFDFLADYGTDILASIRDE